MRVTYCGLCRESRKTFIKLVVDQYASDSFLQIRLESASGVLGRCNAYELANNVFVVVVPAASNMQKIIIDERNAANDILSTFEKTLSPQRIAWESRLRHRFDRALIDEICNYDERHYPIEGHLEFERVIPARDKNIVQAKLFLSPFVSFNDVEIRCTDSDEREFGVRAVSCGEMLVRVPEDGRLEYRAVSVSIDLPKRLDTYTFTVFDRRWCDDAYPVTLENALLMRLLIEFEESTLNAQLDPAYPAWLSNHRAGESTLRLQREEPFRSPFVFSIVVPLYKTPLPLLYEMVESVRRQSYPFWELVLVNASPEDEAVSDAVAKIAREDDRIKVVLLEGNRGISGNTNAGVDQAQGDFVSFLDHDDVIEPDLLFEYAEAVRNHPDVDLLYCDEDKLSEDGRPYDPFFKPDFNIDLLRNNNYICHMLTIRHSMLREVGPLDPACDGAQDFDLTLRVCEKARRIFHVPRVLYHWRVTAASTAGSISGKPYADKAGMLAVRKHFERIGVNASVEFSRRPATYAITYFVPSDRPLVSIIVPRKGSADALRRCIRSIVDLTLYKNYELLVVGDSDCIDRATCSDACIRHIRLDGPPGHSAAIARGASKATGEFYLFLDDDAEVLRGDWIERMLGICAREDVGAVGAKLYYPDDTIQHAGLSIVSNGKSSMHKGLPRDNWGYFALNDAEQDVTAVTSSCMMTKRQVYDEVGGMSEDMPETLREVDFCLKLRRKGLLVVYTPEVELYRHEARIREGAAAQEERSRIGRDRVRCTQDVLQECCLEKDPYRNCNFDDTPSDSDYFKLSWPETCLSVGALRDR